MFDIFFAITFPDWISDSAIKFGRIDIKWYGLSFIAGIMAAYYYAIRTVGKRELFIPEGVTRGSERVPNKALLEDFVFFCMLGIILGGRIGSILLYNTQHYIDNPMEIFQVWKGGMAFHGGFTGVCIAVIYVARKHKVGLWRIADMAAIGAPLGIFSVRLANFVNQELVGRETDVPWAMIFPKYDWTPRHPSQLYEAALEGIVLFLIIRLGTRHFKTLTKPGVSAAIFFLGYGVFRTFVEFFRKPDDNVSQIHEFFTRGMLYSTPMIIIGLILLWWTLKRPPVAPKWMKDETEDKPA